MTDLDALADRLAALPPYAAMRDPLPAVPDPGGKIEPGDLFEGPRLDGDPVWWLVLAWTPKAARLAPVTEMTLDGADASDVAVPHALCSDYLFVHAALQFVTDRPRLGPVLERLAPEVVLEAASCEQVGPPAETRDRRWGALAALRPSQELSLPPVPYIRRPIVARPILYSMDSGPVSLKEIVEQRMPQSPLFNDVLVTDPELGSAVRVRSWQDDPRIVLITGDLSHLTPSDRILALDGNEWCVDSRGAAVSIPLSRDQPLPRLEIADGGVALVKAEAVE